MSSREHSTDEIQANQEIRELPSRGEFLMEFASSKKSNEKSQRR